MNESHQYYVIPRLISKLKSIRSRCISCRKLRAAVQTAKMAVLSMSKLAVYLRVFTYTGLDYFEPMLEKIGR